MANGLNPILSEIPENANLAWVAAKILDRTYSQAVPILKARLAAANLELTGRLLASLSSHVNALYQENVVTAVLQMEAYGALQDLKHLRYTGQPPVNDWGGRLEYSMSYLVQKSMETGTFTYDKVPGYPDGVFPADRSKAIERIAWALARSRVKNPNVTNAGRGWLMKTYFEEFIQPFEQQIMDAAWAVALRTFDAFEKKNQK
ncbi:hypothetical protein [Tellurirhabdus rosea]|uniref:hypothetical protein n=1 Tax=Tellurirhabdus rosea TaxID=2674997 RepID=UPI00225405AE|nr:hypothetical protein [Tellurirhabdus rosea]